MKTLKKVFVSIVCIVMVYGCGSNTNTSEIENDEEEVIFLLTDSPSDDFEGVVVNIESPIVVRTKSGREVNVPLTDNLPIRVDLLALDGVSDLLASGNVPSGGIQDITLTVSNPEITLLDGTVLSGNRVALQDPVMVIVPTAAIDVKKGDAPTVQIDIDADKSVLIDVTGTGTPIFRPRGDAARIEKDKHPNGAKMREIYGTVSAIPGIDGNPSSFLLKWGGNKSNNANAEKNTKEKFLRVDASSAKIFKSEESQEPLTFDAVKIDQRVEVGGVFTEKGLLKASTVFLSSLQASSTEQRAVHGVIKNLKRDLRTFDLRPPPKDRAAESTNSGAGIGTSAIPVHYDTSTRILMEKDHIDFLKPTTGLTASSSTIELRPQDLANGQPVAVRGSFNKDTHILEARFIVVKPVRFKGFISETDCEDKLIEVINLPKHGSLNATGTATSTPQRDPEEWSVDVSEARLLKEGKTATSSPILCTDLREGMAVQVVGINAPRDGQSTGHVKAALVKVIPIPHVSGEVLRVSDNGREFVLGIPAGKSGIAAASNCPTTGCPHRELRVVLAKNFSNPDDIKFNKSLERQKVRAAGFFRGDPSQQPQASPPATNRPAMYFIAVVVRNGLAPDTPIFTDAPVVP